MAEFNVMSLNDMKKFKTKSLLPSLYKREGLPLFGKEGGGEIFRRVSV